MTQRFPYGRPEIIEGSEVNMQNFSLDNYFGIISCVVLPPQDLIIGLLPMMKTNNELSFPLCATCANDEETGFDGCNHSLLARSFRGVFFSEELKFAVSHKYIVLKIFEVGDFSLFFYFF